MCTLFSLRQSSAQCALRTGIDCVFDIEGSVACRCLQLLVLAHAYTAATRVRLQVQQLQVMMSKLNSKGTASARSLLLFPGVVLFVIAVSWRLSVEIHYVSGAVIRSPANAGRISTDGYMVHGAASSRLPQAQVPKQEASIIVVVTSKASSSARRSWFREQFKKNVALIRKQNPAAADGVVMRFAVGNQGEPYGILPTCLPVCLLVIDLCVGCMQLTNSMLTER
jgi:hypothetical protein